MRPAERRNVWQESDYIVCGNANTALQASPSCPAIP